MGFHHQLKNAGGDVPRNRNLRTGNASGFSSTSIDLPLSSNSDYVHDVSYNYYGTRMAMCTSAQNIFIYSLVGKDGEWLETAGNSLSNSNHLNWSLTGSISSAHNAPIWRLDWAHPEFGQVLVTCSEDRTVAIWSERIEGGNDVGIVWRKRASLTDSPFAVTDCQFCPREFGLKFAACASDGMVRVYCSPDPLNLAYWEVEDFSTASACNVAGKQQPVGCTSLSWCVWYPSSRSSLNDYVETLAIACQSGHLKVFQKDNSRTWHFVCERLSTRSVGDPLKDCAWAPNLCREFDWVACCGDSPEVEILQFKDRQLQLLFSLQVGVSPLWRVSWNLTGTLLAIAPENGKVQMWRFCGLKGTSSTEWEKVYDEDPACLAEQQAQSNNSSSNRYNHHYSHHQNISGIFE